MGSDIVLPPVGEDFCDNSRSSIDNKRICIGTWNVEGLTEVKLHEIRTYMNSHSIDIFCIQETHKSGSDYYVSDDGFLVILSGASCEGREWAGVGFIVGPKLRPHIEGYCQISSRIASLKIKCAGGCFGIFSVYAPHNMRNLDERWAFYEELGKHWQRLSVNGSKLIFGDFNARIGDCRPGEEDIIGPYCCGLEAAHRVEVPNRDLFMDFCWSRELCLANSFSQVPLERRVTCHEPGATPMGDVSHGFSMLDLLVTPCDFLDQVVSICSDRSAALASHHFPVVASLQIGIPLRAPREAAIRLNWAALAQPDVRTEMVHQFLSLQQPSDSDLNTRWEALRNSSLTACMETIPQRQNVANKPWISERTLSLLDEKRAARLENDWVSEKLLRRRSRNSAKKDRTAWLENLSATGDWNAMKLLRKKRKRQQGRLRSLSGELVSSECRSHTLADYLEQIQWKVRTATLTPGSEPALRQTLPVSMEAFSERELRRAIQSARSGKSCQDGDAPVEFFKALAQESGSALRPILDFCNQCWTERSVPDTWSNSVVSAIFKKGDPAECSNYRPICLLTVCHKLLMSMIKERLLKAGVDDLIWPSQFGFRTRCSTEHAIYIARRRIELARAQRDGHLSLLALDWAKAFDSLNVESLIDALRRFGLPTDMLDLLRNLLCARTFVVKDCGACSDHRPQCSGISQGCTLSPLLFVMAMSVLLTDATAMLSPAANSAYQRGDLSDVVYADDTLLISVSSTHLEEYLLSVAAAGERYGMELHWDKFQLLAIHTEPALHAPSGDLIPCRTRMQYLGTTLSNDVHDQHELVKRIAMAKQDFLALDCVWKRSSLTWRRKLRIFNSLIESKLLYSLNTICLTVSQERQLNGFQNRCLRTIIGIKPSYVSRVSNAAVLAKAGHTLATDLLRHRQCRLLDQVLQSPEGHPLRNATFIPGTDHPLTERYVRRRGAPSKEWLRTLLPVYYEQRRHGVL